MTNLTRYLPALLMALATPLACAQTPEADPLPPLGDWSSACDAWGVAATCTSVWSQGQHARHRVQNYAIVSRADDSQIFAGRGVYHIAADGVEGMWEDSRGVIQAVSGTYENGVLKVMWGDPQTEIGRSVYAFQDDALRVEDSVLTDQGWRAFMTIEYEPPAR